MFIDLGAIDSLQVERGPTLTRHLDNLIFEFLTSEMGYTQLLNYPSPSSNLLVPSLTPRLPSPLNVRGALNSLSSDEPRTIDEASSLQHSDKFPEDRLQGLNKSIQKVSTSDSVPTYNNGGEVAIPLQRRKIALYAKISIGPISQAITSYEESALRHIVKQYPNEVSLKEEIRLPLYTDREHIQETLYEYVSPYSTFYGEDSNFNANTPVSIADFICEELFGMPKLLASLLFHTLIFHDGPPDIEDLSPQHAPSLPSTIQTQTLVDAYFQHCHGKRYEQRFYSIFTDIQSMQEKRQTNSPCGCDERLSLARLVHIILNVLHSHTAYYFVEPFIYKCALAIVAAARIFFDADPEGKWYLTHDYTFVKMGISLLSYIWTLQSKENITGSMDPLGYEAFYVIYCTFVKNSDNDIQGKVTESLLQQYNNEMYSKRFVERLLDGWGRPLYKRYSDEPALSLIDFTIFFLAECAVDTYSSIRYFYNLADGDRDGLLSLDDLRLCLEEQAEQWSLFALDLTVEEVLSQLVDMIHFVPDDFEDVDIYGSMVVQAGFGAGNVSHLNWQQKNDAIGCIFSFEQILKCAMPFNIFNALFSVQRFLRFEQRDPYVGNLRGDVDIKRPARIMHTASEVWASFCFVAYNQLLADNE